MVNSIQEQVETSSALQEATARILQIAHKKPVNVVFLTRALNALAKLTQAQGLVDVTSASSDYEVLLTILQTPEAIALLNTSDPLAEAKLKGLEIKQQLLTAEGGCISSEEAGTHLGISRQAVDKRRRNGQLIGLLRGKGSYLYPAWQFTNSGTLPGLETVLVQLSSLDPWMQVTFFLNPNLRLQNQTPLEMLKDGEVKAVVESANVFVHDEPS